MNRFVLWLVFVLVIAHHDFWFWNSPDRYLGMPVGLVYHMGLSIITAAVWAFVCIVAWPAELDEFDQEQKVAK